MNLKEAFRYQKFLEAQMHEARNFLGSRDNCLITTRNHQRSAVNPDAADVIETDDELREGRPTADAVIKYLFDLLEEKRVVSEAIATAKRTIEFDVDAAIETNKCRQRVAESIRIMMRHTPKKGKELGMDYKFNAEGNQAVYRYNIETSSEFAYDAVDAKSKMKCVVAEADEISAKIEAALVNTQVVFDPKYSVNDTFDDIMAPAEM